MSIAKTLNEYFTYRTINKKEVIVMTQEEKVRLSELRSQGTLNQIDALIYHELLNKEASEKAVVDVIEETVKAEEVKKLTRKKK